MKIYMQVSRDRFALPEIIAESIPELAAKCGKNTHHLRLVISGKKKVKTQRYICVEVEEDETTDCYDAGGCNAGM